MTETRVWGKTVGKSRWNNIRNENKSDCIVREWDRQRIWNEQIRKKNHNTLEPQ